MVAFVECVAGRLGADQLLMPREVTRDFIRILNLPLQNPGLTYKQLAASGNAQVRPAEADPWRQKAQPGDGVLLGKR